MQQYLGLSLDAWGLIFSAIQALTVTFAVCFGAYQLRDIQRSRRADSLERMFNEWRSHLREHRHILAAMPFHEGTVPERAAALASDACVAAQQQAPDWRELANTLKIARETVHALNDIGVLVERGIVREQDFFSQFHTRVIELVYLLEPYTLLVSTVRGSRWGFRLSRLRTGAEKYHLTSRLHSHLTLAVRGRVVLPGRTAPRRSRINELWVARRLIPSHYRTAESEDSLMLELSELLGKADAMADNTSELRVLFNV